PCARVVRAWHSGLPRQAVERRLPGRAGSGDTRRSQRYARYCAPCLGRRRPRRARASSMTPTDDDDIDVDALEQRFEAALARSRELPYALSPDEMATLALAPFWTEPALAIALDGRDLDAVLDRAGAFLHVEGEAGRRTFSVREPGAPALIAVLRK